MKKILTGLAALATLGVSPTQVLADNLNTMELFLLEHSESKFSSVKTIIIFFLCFSAI